MKKLMLIFIVTLIMMVTSCGSATDNTFGNAKWLNSRDQVLSAESSWLVAEKTEQYIKFADSMVAGNIAEIMYVFDATDRLAAKIFMFKTEEPLELFNTFDADFDLHYSAPTDTMLIGDETLPESEWNSAICTGELIICRYWQNDDTYVTLTAQTENTTPIIVVELRYIG